MRFHAGTFIAGLIYLAAAVAFALEALGVWTLQLSDLRFVGPLALVVAGIAVLFGSWVRPHRTQA